MRKKETINLVKSMDRGSLEFETHASQHEGDVMSIATKGGNRTSNNHNKGSS